MFAQIVPRLVRTGFGLVAAGRGPVTPNISVLAEGESGFEPPTILDFFPDPILFPGTPFQLDRIWIVRVVATLLLLGLMMFAASRMKVRPGRFQAGVEYLFDFVRKQIVDETLGKEEGRRFLPMITTIFFTVLFFNITSVIPGLNIAGTARVGVPLLLALWVFVTYWAQGIQKWGFIGYLKHSLFPESIRSMPYMYIIVTPIELLQLLVVRPGSLIIRLVANMVAGHIMLLLCFSATSYLFTRAHGLLRGAGVLTFAGGLFVTLFELLVAFLQAYIFALLATVYINMSLEEEH